MAVRPTRTPTGVSDISRTYENLATNENTLNFIHESTQDRTPLGHAHHEHICDLSIPEIRELYQQAINQLLDQVAETGVFFQTGIVAINITESVPFTGDRAEPEGEISGRKRNTKHRPAKPL